MTGSDRKVAQASLLARPARIRTSSLRCVRGYCAVATGVAAWSRVAAGVSGV